MMSQKDNEILTRTGPGTPMGELMRQFWIPAAKSSELAADGEPVRLKLLGEKLIAFRDSSGRIGVMDHRCPHRCASLFFARNEEGGVRCVYHGWKFDVDGNCLDMANVPPHQDFKQKVRAKAYKAAERNGLVWVFMGDQAKVPPLPPIEATLVPEGDNEITFIHRDCNWLQGAEGELDTSHIGFLHFGTLTLEAFNRDDDKDGRFAVANRAPEYKSLETDFGYSYAAYRPADPGTTYWRFGQFALPFWTMPPIGTIDRNILTRAYVPLDDENSMIVIVEKKEVIPREEEEKARHIKGHPGVPFNDNHLPNTTDWLGRWRLSDNIGNDYNIDRAMQRKDSFTGMMGFVLQDQMITESMGRVVDRSLEHLAPSDVMISRTRRVLLRAAKDFAEKGVLPKSATDPQTFAGVRGGHFVANETLDWQDAYRAELAKAPYEPPPAQAAE